MRAMSKAIAITLVLLSTRPAGAQSPSEIAVAKSIFDEGERLLKSGKVEEACERFNASVAVLPVVAALLRLGDCSEHLGRTATAWGAFSQAASLARTQALVDHEREAIRRADALAPKLVRLVVTVPPDAAIRGLEVRRDGALVAPALYGIEVAIDPGPHDLEASAPGRTTWTSHLEFTADAQTHQVTIPVLTLAAPASGPGVLGDGPIDRMSDAGVATSRGRGQRRLALITGGVSLVAFGVGATYGLKARSSWRAVTSACRDLDSHYECDAAGRQASADAHSAARISDVMFAVGGVALVAGVVLYLTAPDGAPKAATVRVAPTSGGARVTFGGSF